MDLKKIPRNFGIGILFCFTIAVGFVMQILLPDQSYSAFENRALETGAPFSLGHYLDGSFQSTFENYVSDQFPNRNMWMEMKSKTDMQFNIKLVKDVYVTGVNDYLIQKVDFDRSDPTGSKRAEVINAFQAQYPDVKTSMILVPNKIEMYKEYLPESAPREDQKKMYTSFYEKLNEHVNKVDVMTILEAHKQEDIFYKSDHHWTTLAAKYVSDVFLEGDETAYEVVESNNQFYGTLANKISYYPSKDTIHLYLPKDNPVKYTIDYVESDKQSTSVYDLSKQFDTDAYAIYFGGNHPIMKINTTSLEDRRLLMFKDSYANCFIPFLLPYYSEIVVVDPRYYYGDIDTLMKDENISDVLFLYNMNTFFSDDSIFSLKAK